MCHLTDYQFGRSDDTAKLNRLGVNENYNKMAGFLAAISLPDVQRIMGLLPDT